MTSRPYVRPAPGQPGTLAQQLHALLLYWRDGSRRADSDRALQRAREYAMPHARRAV